MNSTKIIQVEDFSKNELEQLSEILKELRSTGYKEFPPSNLDSISSSSYLEKYSNWITVSETKVFSKWIAVKSEIPVGYISVCAPHDYLLKEKPLMDFLDQKKSLEVSHLFSSPFHSGEGIGRKLLEKATEYIINEDCVPILAVVEESQRAINLYLKSGWIELSRFSGVQGLNLVMVKN